MLQQSDRRLFIVWDPLCRLLHRGPDARVQGVPRLLQSGRRHWTLSIMPGPAYLFIEEGRTMLRFFTEQDDLQVWYKSVSYSLNIICCQFRKHEKLFSKNWQNGWCNYTLLMHFSIDTLISDIVSVETVHDFISTFMENGTKLHIWAQRCSMIS